MIPTSRTGGLRPESDGDDGRETSLPPGFLWGAATSAHQTEGNNTNSHIWYLENLPNSPLPERSGRAVDSFNRYGEEMRLLAEAGLDTYRFSIEWARIEPEPGVFDVAAIQHYRSMISTAASLGLTPVVTLHHFTNPLWFSQAGGWRNPQAPTIFARYVSHVSRILVDVPWLCTINEPNMIAVVGDALADAATSASTVSRDRSIAELALPEPAQDIASALADAHRRAVEVLHANTDARIGWTVSNQAFEPAPGGESIFERTQWAWEDQFLEVARDDDFVGVQAYTTRQIGPDGVLPFPPGPDTTLAGWPNRPEALGKALRHTWQITGGVPILVTENGIATSDDAERIAYIDRALEDLTSAVADGIDVRGYIHWSAVDNFEWGSWRPTFGLIAVDRRTFRREPRPSLGWLGRRATVQKEVAAGAE